MRLPEEWSVSAFLSSSVGFPDTGQVNKFKFFVKIFKVMF